jgi:hypothetical protein
MTAISRRFMLGGLAATAGGVAATAIPLQAPAAAVSRALLGGIAATSLPAALPEAAAGMDDAAIVRLLVDAHKAAMARYDNSPEGKIPDDIIAQMMGTGEALCAYRPTTLEGVHAKAEYMMSCDVFVGGEGSDSDFTPAELVSGFLPATTPGA